MANSGGHCALAGSDIAGEEISFVVLVFLPNKAQVGKFSGRDNYSRYLNAKFLVRDRNRRSPPRRVRVPEFHLLTIERNEISILCNDLRWSCQKLKFDALLLGLFDFRRDRGHFLLGAAIYNNWLYSQSQDGAGHIDGRIPAADHGNDAGEFRRLATKNAFQQIYAAVDVGMIGSGHIEGARLVQTYGHDHRVKLIL